MTIMIAENGGEESEKGKSIEIASKLRRMNGAGFRFRALERRGVHGAEIVETQIGSTEPRAFHNQMYLKYAPATLRFVIAELIVHTPTNLCESFLLRHGIAQCLLGGTALNI